MSKSISNKPLAGSLRRFAGCLLILLLLPINVFAFSNTTSQSDDFTSLVPSVAAIASEAYVNNENTLLFWDKTNNIYYLCTQDDFITKGYGFQVYGEPDGSRLYGAFALTPNMASDLKVYRYNPSIDTDWTQITLPYNGIGYYSYFDIGTLYLYAFLPIVNITLNPADTNEPPTVIGKRGMIIGTSDSNAASIRIYTKYTINSNSFELTEYTATDEEEDEQSGFWTSILKWLKQIKDSITGLVSNLWNNYLSQPFSAITTALSNIGSTIWNAIKSPFEGPVNNPPDGGIIYRLWVAIKAPFEAPDGALYNLPTKIWNAIKAPFGDTTETPPNGGLLWRMWQSIKAPFVEGGVVYEFVNDLIDDIKSLFVPTDEQLEDLKSDYDDFLSGHLGFIYQSYNFVRVLFGDDSDRRVSLVYPRMAQYNQRGEVQTRSINRDVEVVHTVKDLFTYEQVDDVDITISRIRVRYIDSTGTTRTYTFFSGGTYSLDDIMAPLYNWHRDYLNSSSATFNAWNFIQLCISAIFTIGLISNALRILGKIFGGNFDFIVASDNPDGLSNEELIRYLWGDKG